MGEPIELAIAEVDRARKRVAGIRSKQVTQANAIDYLKSMSYAWFRSHRPKVESEAPSTNLNEVDEHFQRILDATGKASARTTYTSALNDAKAALVSLRAMLLVAPPPTSGQLEPPPDFTPLAADPAMRTILSGRWDECQRCIRAEAHFAATVMMGGFLEALFVARANQMPNKAPLFRAKATPVDGKTTKPLALSEWTLRPYIDVAHELGWISRSGKDVAAVLRDYRNYVHPEKQRSHAVTLNGHDAAMFWALAKILTSQLLASASSP